MNKSREQEGFEQAIIKKYPASDLSFADGKYLSPTTEAAWLGWQLKDHDVQLKSVERALFAPRTANQVECIIEAARHVLILGNEQDFRSDNGVFSIRETNAWTRFENAFNAVHPEVESSFPALVDFKSMGMDTKRAFDLIYPQKHQAALMVAERDRLFAMFEYGLVFQTLYPDMRGWVAPLSIHRDSVFLDGIGNVPLDFTQAGTQQHNPHGQPLEFGYTNYRGEYGVRKAIPIRIVFGNTNYHADTQWLLEAFDVEKQENRTYAINDITHFIHGETKEPA
jgi:hypothetical protein